MTAQVLTAGKVDTWNDTGNPHAVAPADLEVASTGDVVRLELPPHTFVTVRGTFVG